MDITKWFNEQKIEPVQDRKDGMDYWKNYELFTWNDVTECLEALKELCEGKDANTGAGQRFA
jgi:tRNA(Leu) C34 or U34 (ribose-2'-O)-methylase TrmL